jgi:FtsZ-binding cell division protein ZapB
MQENQQQSVMVQQTVCTDEKLLAAFEEIKLLREQVEFLHELVESQNLRLQQKEEQLQEVEEELKAVNEDLRNALWLDGSRPFWGDFHLEYLEHVTLFEAKELAKTILASETPTSEFVDELLTLIYRQKMKLEELKQTDKSNLQTDSAKNALKDKIIANSHQLRTQSKHLHERYKELGYRFITFKASFTKIQEYWAEFQTIKKEIKSVHHNCAASLKDK